MHNADPEPAFLGEGPNKCFKQFKGQNTALELSRSERTIPQLAPDSQQPTKVLNAFRAANPLEPL
jgi:hypothetical protein